MLRARLSLVGDRINVLADKFRTAVSSRLIAAKMETETKKAYTLKRFPLRYPVTLRRK